MATSSAVVSPGPIGDWEQLGRRVFSGRDSRRSAKTGVPASVFTEPGRRERSVDRLTRVPDLALLVANANAAALVRGITRQFYGWAVVSVEDVIAVGCQVAESPLADNPYHADIVLPDAVVESADAQNQYAVALAGVANWQPRPQAQD